MKSSQRNADLQTLVYPTLQSKHENERNGQLPNKFWIWLLVTVEIFKVIVNVRVKTRLPKRGWPGHLVTNAYGSGYSRRFGFLFWTTLTSFCRSIIAAKLSVKLLCCLKDEKQCRDCLSQADCYDQSSRRSPACFETTPHYDNISNTLADQLQCWTVVFENLSSTLFYKKILKENGQKRSSKRFSVLSAKFSGNFGL